MEERKKPREFFLIFNLFLLDSESILIIRILRRIKKRITACVRESVKARLQFKNGF